jgi:hypothetical protein
VSVKPACRGQRAHVRRQQRLATGPGSASPNAGHGVALS